MPNCVREGPDHHSGTTALREEREQSSRLSWIGREPEGMDPRSIRTERTESVPSSTRVGQAGLLEKPGRVLAAEVVRQEPSGEFRLSVGREQVSVRSEKPLQVGDRLQVRVEREGNELVLRAVEARAPGNSALVRLLRAHAGSNLDLGQVMSQLETALRSPGVQDPSRAALLAALQGRVVSGELSASGLANLLATSGTNLEARLFQLATVQDANRSPAGLVGDTVEALLRKVAASPQEAADLQRRFAPLFGQVLEAQLAKASDGALGLVTRAGLQRFLSAYVTELSTLVAQSDAKDAGEVRLRQQLVLGLSRAQTHDDGLGFLGPLIRRLLGETGGQAREKLIGALRADWKGRLLAALSSGHHAEEKELIGRVLDSLEQEQAKNLARSEQADGRLWSLALRDGADLTTLKIFRRDEGAQAEDSEEQSSRFSLGVEFSMLGPIRADLKLDPESLTIRVTASEPTTVKLLHEGHELLRSLLERSGRAVSLTVVEGSAEQASIEGLEGEISFLAEQHLLDVAA